MTNTKFIGKHQVASDSLVPVTGYKALSLLRHKGTGTVSVLPVHYDSQSFQFSDTSTCDRKRHVFDKCNCGFYAYKTVEEARTHMAKAVKLPYVQEWPSVIVAEVALSGRTVIAQYGYRAEHQRVTAMEAGRCFRCGKTATCFDAVKSPDYSFRSFMMFEKLQSSCSVCVQNLVSMNEVESQASYESYKPVRVSFR
jgi:hypothetical protein